MTEREQIIEGLLDVVADLSPFAGDHEDWMKVHRAIKYLKESVKPYAQGDDSFACGNCGETVGWEELNCGGISMVKYKYCPECGRAVRWNDD